MRIVIHYDKAAQLVAPIRRRHPEVELSLCTDYTSLPSLLDRHQPEVLFTIRFAGTPGFPRAAIVQSPSLRWVSVGGSGTDHLAPWDSERLTVTNAAGVGAPTMAQFAIAATLHFNLGLHEFAAAQRVRQWVPRPVASLEGRTMLILGLGHTGLAVARLAQAHGLRVVGLRAHPAPAPCVDLVEPAAQLLALLPEADFLVVAVPLTADTKGLIDEAALARLKPGAVLIDLSRGGVVRQAAVRAALAAGSLKGAALDVFETEPLPPDDPLWGKIGRAHV